MTGKKDKAAKEVRAADGICVRKNISKGELVIVEHPLIKHKITLLRNKDTRVNVFRDLVEEVSTLIGFEATSDFPLYEVEVETPVAKTFGYKIEGKKVAIVPILRAGVSMINGLLRLMPLAKIGHIGIYRNPETFEPVEYFCKLPTSISKRAVLLCDPMLATGGSAVAAIDMIKKRGRPVDLGALFGARPVWLEVGFGGGEHLAHQAALNPDIGLIGAEPFVNGVAMALARIEAAGLGNVRIHPGDARDLIDLLPDGGLARVFVLYPDPWPKTRHWERRFMGEENLRALHRIMAPGAELRLASDIPDYIAHALRAVAAAGGFAVQGGPGDWARPWPDWTRTRYEAKALREGRTPQYLSFLRDGRD